ncbi:histone-lysine n-methyltransferase, suvh, putative [Ricinus communis]|uniref:Histone-lysine n-methyltransferase, suvh, putative n=1 Tax=Ricinus communis TaxID=3988 RepID=B9RGX3_RICCO|nr:histone-lysine n-methyltransferase, suvh, putative [Ricinus communis]
MVAVCVDSSREVEREKENKSITEGTMKRRVSARIQATKQQRAEKEELVRKRVELLDENGERNKKRANVFSRRRVNVDDVNEEHKHEHEHEHEHEHQDEHEEVMVVKEKEKEMQVSSTEALKSQVANVNEKIAGVVTEKSVNARVKETLRLFNKHYLHFVQKKAKRPDLKAISKMIETNAIMYPEKKIGDLPGIDVGHQFYSRAEMVAIGFHSHWLNGIDYMGLSYSKEYRDYTFPIAIAIVLSGMYEDDLDNAEDVIYTGQGGHDLTGNKRQIRDQVMERGNLALKNCVEQSMPVRVVRGHESTSSYSGKVYTYDGLYKVVQYWAEKGISGFTVYKYRLRRLEGQPTLTTNQVHFVYGRVPQSISEIRGLVCEDISRGQEVVPIPATNLVDDPPVPPTGIQFWTLNLSGFTYRKALQVSKNIKLPTNAVGCDCKGACLDPRTCACAKLNGSDFPYVHRDGGRLIEAKAIVFECGPNCGCGSHCVNRTAQRGLKYRFEVFRTPKKGWAVRSWDFIPSGAPICEYVGVLRRTEDLDNVSENNYIFEIDCLQTMKGIGGRERRLGDVSVPTISNTERLDDQKSESVPEFCIDAGSYGNIARFINHSCEPNLFVQCVLSSHQDLKLARVMLFAADNIPPLQGCN